MKQVMFLLAMATAFTACQSGNRPGSTSDSATLADSLPGTTTTAAAVPAGAFQGLLPCADCPGIDYQVNLFPDSTFEAITSYQGRGNNIASVSIGNWITDATGVILLTDKSDTTRFRYEDHKLFMVDATGQKETGALASNYTLKSVEGGGNREHLQQKAASGINFTANGNEPGWSLDISKKDIFFQTMNGDSLRVPLPAARPSLDTLKVYTVPGKITVSIRNTICADDMSGYMRPNTVEVQVKETTYRGCGQYLK